MSPLNSENYMLPEVAVIAVTKASYEESSPSNAKSASSSSSTMIPTSLTSFAFLEMTVRHTIRRTRTCMQQPKIGSMETMLRKASQGAACPTELWMDRSRPPKNLQSEEVHSRIDLRVFELSRRSK